MLLCIVSVPFCSSVLNTKSVSLFLSQRYTFDVQCLTTLLLNFVSPLDVVISLPVTRTWCSISVILINATLLFRRVIYRHIDFRETNIELPKCSRVDWDRHAPQLWTVLECTDFLEPRLRCPCVVSTAHNESWWGCADRITRLRYKGYNPIIVFNYYQNHEGTLYYYYYPYLFLWNLFFSWMKVFFTDIFAFCVMSVSFELLLLRVHPFSFDETFVFPCVSFHPNLMMSVVTKWSRKDLSLLTKYEWHILHFLKSFTESRYRYQ